MNQGEMSPEKRVILISLAENTEAVTTSSLDMDVRANMPTFTDGCLARLLEKLKKDELIVKKNTSNIVSGGIVITEKGRQVLLADLQKKQSGLQKKMDKLSKVILSLQFGLYPWHRKTLRRRNNVPKNTFSKK